MPFIPYSQFLGHQFFKQRHLETVMPALFRNVKVNYKRERITTSDDDFIDLDWTVNHSNRLLILLHGLEGSSNSQYIKGFAQYFNKNNFDVCAVNFRGCSGSDNLKLPSYHSGATSDVVEIISHIETKKKYTEIVMIGFSLGGNVLLKYLGEQNSNVNTKIKCAVAFSVPCDLSGSSNELAKRGNKIYMQRFLKTLKKKMKNKAKRLPNQISLIGIENITEFKTFDDRYTAPIHGFKDANDYWNKCSSKQFLSSIQIPTLLVSALNDPFLSASCFPIEEAKSSNCFYLETPKYGGHVGFSISLPNGKYWSEQRAFEFINEHINSSIEKKN